MTQTLRADQVLVIDPVTDAEETGEVIEVVIGRAADRITVHDPLAARALFDCASAEPYSEGSYTVSLEDYAAVMA